jgi:hypothetical protein
MMTWWTIALVISVHLPVAIASGTVVDAEWKYDRVTHPRSHGPQ